MFSRAVTIFAIYTTFRVAAGNAKGNVTVAAYIEDKSRANYVFSNPLFNRSSLTLISCTAKCLFEKMCYGVAFNEEQTHCQGYARFSGPVISKGAKVWTKRIRCHASYIYDPNSDLCFQLFGVYSWPDAIAFCAEDDSRLVVFDTLEKLQFYRNYVDVINDGIGRTIGGRNVNGVWKWIDGSIMSMSKKFWRIWEPTGTGSYIAASIYPGLDGIFNDVAQGNRHIVCEKP